MLFFLFTGDKHRFSKLNSNNCYNRKDAYKPPVACRQRYRSQDILEEWRIYGHCHHAKPKYNRGYKVSIVKEVNIEYGAAQALYGKYINQRVGAESRKYHSARVINIVRFINYPENKPKQ